MGRVGRPLEPREGPDGTGEPRAAGEGAVGAEEGPRRSLDRQEGGCVSSCSFREKSELPRVVWVLIFGWFSELAPLVMKCWSNPPLHVARGPASDRGGLSFPQRGGGG